MNIVIKFKYYMFPMRLFFQVNTINYMIHIRGGVNKEIYFYNEYNYKIMRISIILLLEVKVVKKTEVN